MNCPDCHSKVSSYDEYCRKCGADLNLTKKETNEKKQVVLFWTF